MRNRGTGEQGEHGEQGNSGNRGTVDMRNRGTVDIGNRRYEKQDAQEKQKNIKKLN